jgi:hypothetical protein
LNLPLDPTLITLTATPDSRTAISTLFSIQASYNNPQEADLPLMYQFFILLSEKEAIDFEVDYNLDKAFYLSNQVLENSL